MSAPVWVVSSPSVVREHLGARHDSTLFISGLVDLLRRHGTPRVIAVDTSAFDLRLGDAALKIQLKFPGACLVALVADTPVKAPTDYADDPVDLRIGPEHEWDLELGRLDLELELLGQLNWTGKSEALRQLSGQVLQAAPADIAVLVTGESGAGKELVARALHDHSPRARGPFTAVNTSAIPETLLESELFGHEKGSFTGAASRHRGIFESSRGGTVFLDEIGDMPLAMQVKLLRVLETRRFRRLGGQEELAADVRIISATHRDLAGLEQSGAFRRDLYYRLSAITLRVAPLAERPSDLLPLLYHFWSRLGDRASAPEGVSGGAARLLWKYPWPGNVRELRNFAEATSVAVGGDTVNEEHVLQYVQRQRGSGGGSHLPAVTDARVFGGDQEMVLRAILHLSQQVRDLQRTIEERLPSPADAEPAAFRPPASTLAGAERRAIEAALVETGGNRREAARKLGIGERTLYRKIKEYDLR